MSTSRDPRKRFKLRNLMIDRIDLVDKGANQHAHIVIAKGADMTDLEKHKDKMPPSHAHAADNVAELLRDKKRKKKGSKADGSAFPERDAAMIKRFDIHQAREIAKDAFRGYGDTSRDDEDMDKNAVMGYGNQRNQMTNFTLEEDEEDENGKPKKPKGNGNGDKGNGNPFAGGDKGKEGNGNGGPPQAESKPKPDSEPPPSNEPQAPQAPGGGSPQPSPQEPGAAPTPQAPPAMPQPMGGGLSMSPGQVPPQAPTPIGGDRDRLASFMAQRQAAGALTTPMPGAGQPMGGQDMGGQLGQPMQGAAVPPGAETGAGMGAGMPGAGGMPGGTPTAMGPPQQPGMGMGMDGTGMAPQPNPATPGAPGVPQTSADLIRMIQNRQLGA